ncbi:hypothetical protein [Actinomadura sp. 3N407]|uniref:hypothetical protein n=1 Tax=Actinomadura sp. 3N407 TaxID=3457423 RepID=UPI003FCC5040
MTAQIRSATSHATAPTRARSQSDDELIAAVSGIWVRDWQTAGPDAVVFVAGRPRSLRHM